MKGKNYAAKQINTQAIKTIFKNLHHSNPHTINNIVSFIVSVYFSQLHQCAYDSAGGTTNIWTGKMKW